MDSANSAEKRFARGYKINYRNDTFGGLLLNTATGMIVTLGPSMEDLWGHSR
jgi:hypothetical protein